MGSSTLTFICSVGKNNDILRIGLVDPRGLIRPFAVLILQLNFIEFYWIFFYYYLQLAW